MIVLLYNQARTGPDAVRAFLLEPVRASAEAASMKTFDENIQYSYFAFLLHDSRVRLPPPALVLLG
jgi:hypothetical protein